MPDDQGAVARCATVERRTPSDANDTPKSLDSRVDSPLAEYMTVAKEYVEQHGWSDETRVQLTQMKRMMDFGGKRRANRGIPDAADPTPGVSNTHPPSILTAVRGSSKQSVHEEVTVQSVINPNPNGVVHHCRDEISRPNWAHENHESNPPPSLGEARRSVRRGNTVVHWGPPPPLNGLSFSFSPRRSSIPRPIPDDEMQELPLTPPDLDGESWESVDQDVDWEIIKSFKIDGIA